MDILVVLGTRGGASTAMVDALTLLVLEIGGPLFAMVGALTVSGIIRGGESATTVDALAL